MKIHWLAIALAQTRAWVSLLDLEVSNQCVISVGYVANYLLKSAEVVRVKYTKMTICYCRMY